MALSLEAVSATTRLYEGDAIASPALKRLRYKKTAWALPMRTASALPQGASIVVTVTLKTGGEEGGGGNGGGNGGGKEGKGGDEGGGLGQCRSPAGHPMHAAAALFARGTHPRLPQPATVVPLPGG